MKIAVLGASGLMAEAALYDLAANPKVTRIWAADLDLSRARAILPRLPNRRKIIPVACDLTATAAAARKLRGADAVLHCAWYEHNLKAMDLSLALKAHYVDLGGLYHATLKQLKRQADFSRAGLVACLGAGSTPGITNMMAARLAQGFDAIDTVGIYDACHDPSLTDANFLPPFSIRTMLEEYEAPAPVFKNGRVQMLPAHGDPEILDFRTPIGRVRAGAVIHSEVATLPEYLEDKGVRNLFFKIAYPDSVKSQLAVLSAMGASSKKPIRLNGFSVSPLGFVTALALNAARAGVGPRPLKARDFEILRVRVSGRRGSARRVLSLDCEIRPLGSLSAGAIGVGFTGAVAAAMLVGGETKVLSGVGAPESVLQPDPFFAALRSRKAFSFVERIEQPFEQAAQL